MITLFLEVTAANWMRTTKQPSQHFHFTAFGYLRACCRMRQAAVSLALPVAELSLSYFTSKVFLDVIISGLFFLVNLHAEAYPSWMHTTFASWKVHLFAIAPQTLFWHTSTLPSCSFFPSTRRTSPSMQLDSAVNSRYDR